MRSFPSAISSDSISSVVGAENHWDTNSHANLISALQAAGGTANLNITTDPTAYTGSTFTSGLSVAPTAVPAIIATTGAYAIPLAFDTLSGTGNKLAFSGNNTNYTKSVILTSTSASVSYPAEFAVGALPQGTIYTKVPIRINGNNTITGAVTYADNSGIDPYLTLVTGALDIEASIGTLYPATTAGNPSFDGLTSGSLTIGLTAAAAVDWSTIAAGTISVPITIGANGSLKI